MNRIANISSKSILLIIVFVILLLVAMTAERFARSDGADLRAFLFDVVPLEDNVYEPFFAIISIPFQYIASYDALVWLPSFIVGASVAIHIISSTQRSLHLKLFWALCLILPLSLINFRVGCFFVLFLFTNKYYNYWGMFFHWTYVFLLAKKIILLKIKYIFLALFAVLTFIVISNNVDFFVGKINAYVFEIEFNTRFFYTVPIETILLLYLFNNIYIRKHLKALLALIQYCWLP